MFIGSGGSSGYCFNKLSSLEEVHYFYLLAGVAGSISLLVRLTIYIIHYLLYLRDMNVLCVYSIIISYRSASSPSAVCAWWLSASITPTPSTISCCSPPWCVVLDHVSLKMLHNRCLLMIEIS